MWTKMYTLSIATIGSHHITFASFEIHVTLTETKRISRARMEMCAKITLYVLRIILLECLCSAKRA